MPVFIWMSRAMAARGISPNAISVLGMIAGVGAGVCFWATGAVHDAVWSRVLLVIGAALVQGRLLCNMLDGMVAIESGRASPVGELYNEIPDRVSDLATLIGFGWAVSGHPMLGVLAGALAVLTAYVRAAAKVAGAPQDYRGPMAKQQRMFLVTLAGVYLASVPESWRWIAGDARLGVACVTLGVICLGCVVTCVRRVGRAHAVLMATCQDQA